MITTIDLLNVVEETAFLFSKDDILEAKNLMSFQNVSNVEIEWTTIPFSETNFGGVLSPNDERVFVEPKTIYFRLRRHSKSRQPIHLRGSDL